MADLFDLEQTAGGLKANLPQSRQVAQMLADIKVACVVDGGFSPQSTAFFVVLLDACSFVVDVQRRNDSVGDHPRAKRPRRASSDPAFKDQLNLFGTPDVEILPYGPINETAPKTRLGTAV